MRKVQVIFIVIGAGSVRKDLEKWVAKLDIQVIVALMQKTTPLGRSELLRKVLETLKTTLSY